MIYSPRGKIGSGQESGSSAHIAALHLITWSLNVSVPLFLPHQMIVGLGFVKYLRQ